MRRMAVGDTHCLLAVRTRCSNANPVGLGLDGAAARRAIEGKGPFLGSKCAEVELAHGAMNSLAVVRKRNLH